MTTSEIKTLSGKMIKDTKDEDLVNNFSLLYIKPVPNQKIIALQHEYDRKPEQKDEDIETSRNVDEEINNTKNGKENRKESLSVEDLRVVWDCNRTGTKPKSFSADNLKVIPINSTFDGQETDSETSSDEGSDNDGYQSEEPIERGPHTSRNCFQVSSPYLRPEHLGLSKSSYPNQTNWLIRPPNEKEKNILEIKENLKCPLNYYQANNSSSDFINLQDVEDVISKDNATSINCDTSISLSYSEAGSSHSSGGEQDVCPPTSSDVEQTGNPIIQNGNEEYLGQFSYEIRATNPPNIFLNQIDNETISFYFERFSKLSNAELFYEKIHGFTFLQIAILDNLPKFAMYSAYLMKLSNQTAFEVFVNSQDNEGRTALYLSTLCNQQNVCEFLVVECNALIEIADKELNTPLHIACQSGENYLQIVVMFTKQKFIGHLEIRNSIGRTPLHEAVNCHAKILKENNILEKINNIPIVQQLLSSGAKLDVVDKYGFTPIHLAVKNRRIDMLEKLHECGALCGFDVAINIRDYDCKTALDLACSDKDNPERLKMVEKLLSYSVS